MHILSFAHLGNTFLKRAKNTEQIPLWFNRKIQFQILKFPRFDLHVLHVLNSIIKSPKSKISNYISSV